MLFYDSKKCAYRFDMLTHRPYSEVLALPKVFQNDQYVAEVLAPASIDTYKKAIDAGADAIYFGYKELNARAGGNNIDNIKEITDYCHLFRVKAYLAINIEIKNSEIDLARKIIKEAEEAKIDAFIISDLALVKIIKKYSKASIHASTQMGVHNRIGAEFLASLGFDRVVLSREVTIEDIIDIKDNVNIEVEVFVHGALCVGFSGACLFSSMLTGNSGNRGRCAQLCRHKYQLYLNNTLKQDGYLLSAKDINMSNKLQELEKIEVDSLKIEGRLKRLDYVAGVTEIYRTLMYEDRKTDPEEDVFLKKLYNRGGFCNGYFDNNDIIYPYVQNHIGYPIGEITHKISKNKYSFSSEEHILPNEGFKVLRNNLEVGGGMSTQEFFKLDNVIVGNFDAEVGDVVCKTSDLEISKHIEGLNRKILMGICVKMTPQRPLKVWASAHNLHFEFTFEDVIPEFAISRPYENYQIYDIFSKLGGTLFEMREKMHINTRNSFLPKSVLNNVRRRLVEMMMIELPKTYEREKPINNTIYKVVPKEKILGEFVQVKEIKQITSLVESRFENIVYSPSVYTVAQATKFYNKVKNANNKVFIMLPMFIPTSNIEISREIVKIFDGVFANNLCAIQLAQEENKLIVGGYNLNITNNKNPLIGICNQYVASVELNRRELNKFDNCLVYSYGNLPLMYLNHCPKKTAGLSCSDCSINDSLELRDKQGKYPITTQKMNKYCQHIMKNGVTTAITESLENKFSYYDFSNKTPEEINYVLKNKHIDDNKQYNKLHLNRGVK